MQLTISPTEDFFMQGKLMVRLWRGTDGYGVPVAALVTAVCAEAERWDNTDELISIPQPAADEATRWAEKILTGAVQAESTPPPVAEKTPDKTWYLCMRAGNLEGVLLQGSEQECLALAKTMIGQPVVSKTASGWEQADCIEEAWVTDIPPPAGADRFFAGSQVTPELEGGASSLECTQVMMMLFAEAVELLQSRQALGRRRAEVEALGHRLFGLGGMDAMMLVEQTVRRMYPHGQGGETGWHPRELSVCWSGVGTWRD